MIQLILHLVGDYLTQSDWMALEKTKRSLPCLIHVVLYTLPFLLLTQSPWALAAIAVSHFIMDRWRLIRYANWLKNTMAPLSAWHGWRECTGTGYHKDRPAWMAVWLMIIADNTAHLACNYVALAYL